jgi:ABC-type branched-subunit amino acid transport system ATPase component
MRLVAGLASRTVGIDKGAIVADGPSEEIL